MVPTNPTHALPPGKNAMGGFVPPSADSPSKARALRPVPGGGAPVLPAGGPSARPHLLGLLLALRRRWLLGTTLGLLFAAVAAAAAWYVLPPTATVRTLLHVSTVQPRFVFETAEARADFMSFQRSQVALIKTRRVLIPALRKPEVAQLSVLKEQPDPVTWLGRQIQADFSIAPTIFRIAMTGEKEEDLKKLVTAIREAYLTHIADSEHNKRYELLDNLKGLCDALDGKLRTKRDTLQKLAKPLGSKDAKVLAYKHHLDLKHLNMLESQLLAYRGQLHQAQLKVLSRRDKQKAITEGDVSDTVLDEAIKSDKLVGQLTRQITKHDADLAQLRINLKEDIRETDKGYQETLAALKEAKSALDKRRKELRPQLAEELRKKAQDSYLSEVTEGEEALKELRKFEQELAKDVMSRAKGLEDFSQSTADLESLRDDIRADEDLVKAVGKQRQALEVEIAAPRRVDPKPLEETIVSDPATPQKRIRSSAMAGVAVFGLVLFGVSFWEFRAQRVNSAEEVVQGLGMKLVGTLPLLPEGVRRRLGGPKNARDVQWHNRFNESLNAARTALLHTAHLESMQVIMVTSALQGEGKSLVSCHLAVNLARAGYKTLLVDGDLRRPAVHKLFGLEPRPGLSEVLRGEVAADGAVRAGPLEGLSVLPAGQRDERTLRALAQGRAGAIWDGFKDAFDFIVIDSPPILAVADALLIGQQADGVVFSVLRDVSRLPAIHAAYERLAMLNIRILGAVVNGGPSPLYGSDYTPESLPATQA